MKKINKISLLLIVITISFIVGINKVEARDDITCKYMLPFTGINPSNGKYLEVDSKFPCYSSSGENKYKDCSIVATISSEDPGVDSDVDAHWWISLDTGYHYVDTRNDIYGYGDHSSGTGEMLFGATDKAFSCSSELACASMPSEFDDPSNLDAHVHIKSTSNKCPAYIMIKIPSNNLSIAYKQKLTAFADEKAATQWDNIDHIYYGPGADEDLESASVLAYKISDENTFKNKLNNFNNLSTTSAGDNSFKYSGSAISLYDNVVLPLVSASGNVDAKSNSATIDSTTGKFRDIIIGSWIDLIDKQLKNMKTNCGKDYGKYINLKNYKDEVPASTSGSSSKSVAFIEYAKNGNNLNNGKTVSADSGIDSKCWNARRDYLKAYETFRIFMYSIGATTDGEIDFEAYSGDNVFAESILKDNNVTHASNNIVKSWDSFVCFFRFVRYGEDDDNFSKCSSGNEAVEEKQKNSKNVVNSSYAQSLFYTDKCAYKCFGSLSVDDILSKTENWFEGQYGLCKKHSTGVGTAKTDGASYEDCVKAYSECGGSNYNDKEETCKKNAGGSTSNSAYIACIKSYTSETTSETFDSCMDGKIPNWSTKSKEAYNNATSAYEKAIEEYTVSGTYDFEDAGLLRFKYGLKKYTPKCKDITFLTSIWSVIIVLAPFLLIIYASYDYFKCVMAGDEEKMKVVKKKIPRRVIALVILLVFPAVLKMLVTKFGTHGSQNTKYIRCILARDLGESEDEDEEDSTSDDGKDVEAKEKSESKKDE